MSPVVLGIDTSGSWCSVALVDGPTTHVRRSNVGNAHSEHVLAQVDAVLADASRELTDCDAIAFAAGPGSFTGVRVACAVAQGLAFGADRPVAAVGTLDALAHSVPDEPEGSALLVAQDARMGEVYWSVFRFDGGRWSSTAGPALVAPARLLELLSRSGATLPLDIGCGNAWRVHGDAMTGLVARVVHRDSADAVDVARLGASAWCEGRSIDAADAMPVYVRDQVASTTAERASRAREAATP